MPPDLVAVLDAAACEEMRARYGDKDAYWYDDDLQAHVWWTQILPEFVHALLTERDAARAERNAARVEWERLIQSRHEVCRQRDAAVSARDAAEKARKAAEEAHDAAVDEATKANMNVVGVQQSQQRRIALCCARIEELEGERERLITQMIS